MQTQDGFVLDCSVTMAWCFDDEATPYTDGVRDSLADMQAVVPSIWPLEAANATIVGERRKRLDEARSRRFFVLLEALPIILDEETGTRAFAIPFSWPELTSFPPMTLPIWSWLSGGACRWPASTAS